MIYVNSAAPWQQNQPASPGNSPAPSAPGKIITPKETHSFLRNNDLPAMGWRVTKGSLYMPDGYPQIRSADGEFEMQYQLSDDDLDSLFRYDGKMSIKLYLGYASQTQLTEPSKGLFDVYLRIPEAIASARLPASGIPPATPDKPYLVSAHRTETYTDGTTGRLRITNLSDLKTQVAYGDARSPEITIDFRGAKTTLNGYMPRSGGLTRTDLNIPEGAICIKSAPDPLDIISVQNAGISVIHEPSAHTLSPDDDGAAICVPYACRRYDIAIPAGAFPKGFSVTLTGGSFYIYHTDPDTTISRVTDFYPPGTCIGSFRKLTQTGDNGRTWVVQ